MRLYQVGVGYSGVVLEYHRLEAENRYEARNKAIRELLEPGKGYNYIVVKPVTQMELAQERRLKRLLEKKLPPMM